MRTNTKTGTITTLFSLGILLFASLASRYVVPVDAVGPVTDVSILDNSFNPQAIIVGAPNTTSGEYATITWTNNGNADHTVTSSNGTPGTPDGLFDSGIILPLGHTFTLHVNQTMYNSITAKYPDGFVHYYCSFHFSSGMVGTISVSSTPVPEFSLPTLLLAIIAVSVVLLYMARYRRSKLKS